MLDGTVAFETVDWLETKAPTLDQPWLLVSSMVNPHDIMFYLSDPIEMPPPGGAMGPLKTPQQRLGWFDKQWDIGLPDNFADDLALQPFGVHAYKESTEFNYGRVPDDRTDLWLRRRNYLVNCMRLVDAQFATILDGDGSPEPVGEHDRDLHERPRRDERRAPHARRRARSTSTRRPSSI